MTIQVSSVNFGKKTPKSNKITPLERKTRNILKKMKVGESRVLRHGYVTITKKSEKSDVLMNGNIHWIIDNKTGQVVKKTRSIWSHIFGPSNKSLRSSLKGTLNQIIGERRFAQRQKNSKPKMVLFTPEGAQNILEIINSGKKCK